MKLLKSLKSKEQTAAPVIRRVLITDATSTLCCMVLRDLLSADANVQIGIIVNRGWMGAAKERIRACRESASDVTSADTRECQGLSDEDIKRMHLLEGDLKESKLGLDESDYKRWVMSDAIVHKNLEEWEWSTESVQDQTTIIDNLLKFAIDGEKPHKILHFISSINTALVNTVGDGCNSNPGGYDTITEVAHKQQKRESVSETLISCGDKRLASDFGRDVARVEKTLADKAQNQDVNVILYRIPFLIDEDCTRTPSTSVPVAVVQLAALTGAVLKWRDNMPVLPTASLSHVVSSLCVKTLGGPDGKNLRAKSKRCKLDQLTVLHLSEPVNKKMCVTEQTKDLFKAIGMSGGDQVVDFDDFHARLNSIKGANGYVDELCRFGPLLRAHSAQAYCSLETTKTRKFLSSYGISLQKCPSTCKDNSLSRGTMQTMCNALYNNVGEESTTKIRVVAERTCRRSGMRSMTRPSCLLNRNSNRNTLSESAIGSN